MNGDRSVNGVVFEDFIALVEDRYGLEMVDTVLDQPGLASGGVYTADCDYDDHELLALANAFGVETGSHTAELLHELGGRLFAKVIKRCPALVSGQAGSLNFVEQIENDACSPEVDTYLDASILTYAFKHIGSGELLLKTTLPPPLRQTVIGFFVACAEHFGESLSVDDLPGDETTTVLCIGRPSS